MGSCVSQYSRHAPITAAATRRDVELPGPAPSLIGLGPAPSLLGPASSLPSRVNAGEAEDGEHSEDDTSHSHSPASSQCSATYSNLGQSRAAMIPLKQPRNIKASCDTLASIDLECASEPPPPHPQPPQPPLPKATPPPLPKKVPRPAGAESSQGSQGSLRPRAEAKPGGTNLSVANPLYDLDSTWETASQSSSISSEAPRADSGDSLDRQRPPNANAVNAGAASSLQATERRAHAEPAAGRTRKPGHGGGGGSKPQRAALYRGLDSWDEVVGRIRGLHTDTLRKLAAKCEDRFMAGQRDHLRFGTDSWSHFRLTGSEPCCSAGDAVYYTAAYAKDPRVNYAIKICRSQVKETQQQFFHSLAVRQSLALHFNIQQDCGHFLADVPARLLPWEEEEEEEGEGEAEEEPGAGPEKGAAPEAERTDGGAGDAPNGKAEDAAAGAAASHMTSGRLRSRVVVITREVPFQTVADFVAEGVSRHAHNPELYERQVCLLLLQLCCGLEHLKPYHVTHCDLRLENLLLVHAAAAPAEQDATAAPAPSAAATSTCPARLIISNFSQAKQKSALAAADPGALRDHARLAPEIVTATQYRKCDEFQTGILIYEMLHRPNPFEETPELKEREYTWADLPPLPARSLYSQGLQQLARLLLTVNPSERIRMAQARACLQGLLWGPREDLFQALGCGGGGGGGGQREATLQNWLDLKRTLMMIKFAERSLDAAAGVGLEDWLCCQYLAFATTDSLARVVRILQPPPPPSSPLAAPPHAEPPPPPPHAFHLPQPL